MECQTCKSVNDASNRFCKECGSKLVASAATPPPEEVVEQTPEAAPVPPEIMEKRRARVAELLPRAFAFAEKGALAEAIATAEEAVGLVPTSTAAHALLSNLYEKSGQQARAIESMKKVVALTPEGTEEKSRLDSLQRVAAQRAAAPKDEEEKPLSLFGYWMPRVGAALAGALVVGIGLSLMMRPAESTPGRRTNRTTPTPSMTVGERSSGAALASMPGVQQPVVQQPVYIPAPTNPNVDPFTSKGLAPTAAPHRGGSPSSPLRRQTLRRPTPQEPERPFTPEPPQQLVPPVVVAQPVPRDSGSSIPAQPSTERIPVAPPSEKRSKPDDEGFIRIESHPANSGGSAEKAPEKTEGDPAQQARTLQGAGRYRDAVGRYQVALAASEAPAELHQNLGLCYQRLGDMGAARDSYSRAIDAYQAQLRRGRDVESAQRGITSCQAALEILRG